MIRFLVKNWWLLLVRGILALVFGVAIFALAPFFPALLLREMAFTALVLLFGVFAVICGLLTIAASSRSFTWRSWPLLADGIALFAVGMMVLVLPNLTLRAVVYMIAIGAWLAGTFEIAAGVTLRRHLRDEWLLIAGGIGSLGFGSCLMLFGGRDIASALFWIGWYALASGAAITGLAVRLRRVRSSIEAVASRIPAKDCAA